HAVQELTSVMRTGKKYSVLPIFDSIVGEIQEKNKDYILTTFLLIASNISFVMHELELNPAEIADRTNSIITELSKSDGQAGAVIMRNWLSAVCDMISGEFQKRGNNVVNRVCDYINANYNKPIGLAEASRCVERNPSYVSRLVREYTGQSFTQILTDKRITEAKTLLRDTSLKISEISEKVGYINSRYFNRVFRANVNMSANDYRNFAAAFPQ
ncbi:MAG: AraC family transcriptional regulator, partial [Oscillospiraceae bacterium]